MCNGYMTCRVVSLLSAFHLKNSTLTIEETCFQTVLLKYAGIKIYET